MSDDKITKLSDITNDATFSSPRQSLEEALECLGKSGAFKDGKKLLILGLDDADERFSVSFIQAGMKMSECLALCEVAKTLFLEQMEYINNE